MQSQLLEKRAHLVSILDKVYLQLTLIEGATND